MPKKKILKEVVESVNDRIDAAMITAYLSLRCGALEFSQRKNENELEALVRATLECLVSMGMPLDRLGPKLPEFITALRWKALEKNPKLVGSGLFVKSA